MDLLTAIARLRSLNKAVPLPRRLPSQAEIAAVETELGREFPLDYRRFLAEASDVVVGTLEPAVVTPDAGYLDLVEVARMAWEVGVPADWLPFCEDNGNYFCLVGTLVRYWAHDGATDESWPDLATWISDVWIGRLS
jgi:hypothetical protein